LASRCSQVGVTRAEIEVDRNHPDLDTDGAVRLAALRTSSALPTPITFSSTFPGRHRYFWRVDWFPTEPKGSPSKRLAIAIGSYPTCTGCRRGLRLMGFANCKNDPAYHVTVEYSGDSTWDSDDFRLDIPDADAILSSRTFTARKHPSNPQIPNMIGRRFCMSLPVERTSRKLTRKLTSRRADKRNSLYQGQRTADVASARLRVGESIPIEEAVILLEGLRHIEIPLVLCRARARKAHILCAGAEAIIPDSISCWSKNGASHRKNFDTPPLGGNCRETCESSRGNILASDTYRVLGFREETRVYLRKTRVSERWSDGAAR
jgi:hypothetical protein